jgi:hypothetical protein
MMTLTGSLAYADGSSSSQPLNGSLVLNDQTQLKSVTTKVNTEAQEILGDFVGQSVAGGNSLDVTTMQDSWVTNKQYTSAQTISSDLSANVKNIGGSVDLRSQAFCNDANISTDPTTTDVYSSQECTAVDPSATLNATVQNIGGDFQSASVAFGNTFAEDTNAPNAPVQNYQVNNSGVNAINNTNVYNVKGSTAVIGSAIGNNAQIVHYNTDGQ